MVWAIEPFICTNIMESNGRWIDLHEIESLLRWQYSHLVELDDFLVFSVRGYKSIFLKDKAWYDRTFIGWTITRFNWFRNGIGKGLVFANKPTDDLINEIDTHTKWLVKFKKKRKPLSETDQSVGESYITLHVGNLLFILGSVNNFILDREFNYVQNLEHSLGKREVKKKLLELASDKLKATQACRLRDNLREKEQELYALLSDYFEKNDADNNPKSSSDDKHHSYTVVNNIHTDGNGNVINTGNNSKLKAIIHQNIDQQSSTPEILKANLSQLANQIREYFDQLAIDDEDDAKNEVAYQLESIERQLSKEKPKLYIVSKALQTIEELVLNTITDEITPSVLKGIRHLLIQLTK